MSDLEKVNPLKDVSNDRSMINIVPASVANALKHLADDVLEMPEDELREYGEISEREEKLRIMMWKEYDSCQSTGKKLNLSNVYTGVCSQTYFLNRVVTSPSVIIFVLWAIGATDDDSLFIFVDDFLELTGPTSETHLCALEVLLQFFVGF